MPERLACLTCGHAWRVHSLHRWVITRGKLVVPVARMCQHPEGCTCRRYRGPK